MLIELIPQRRDDTLTVTKTGDMLTINGVDYDFSVLTVGDILPPDGHDCEYIVGDVVRTAGGEINLTLILPLGASASNSARFPSAISSPPDGAIALPV